jgi:hypothetical protein
LSIGQNVIVISDLLSALGLAVSVSSLIVSASALGFVLYDRRSGLIVRLREGRWVELPSKTLLKGEVEVYNRSSRPNTISAYRYSAQTIEDKWVDLETERYDLGASDGIHNETPLVVPAYTGVVVKIASFADDWRRFPRHLTVRMRLVDIFGMTYDSDIPVENRFGK